MDDVTQKREAGMGYVNPHHQVLQVVDLVSLDPENVTLKGA